MLSNGRASDLSSHTSLSLETLRFDSCIGIDSNNGDSDCADTCGVPPTASQSVSDNITTDIDLLMRKAYGALLLSSAGSPNNSPWYQQVGISNGLLLLIMVAVTTHYLVALLGGSILMYSIMNYSIFLFLDHIVLSESLFLALLCSSMIAWCRRAVILEDFLITVCLCGLQINLMFFYRKLFVMTGYFAIVIVLSQ